MTGSDMSAALDRVHERLRAATPAPASYLTVPEVAALARCEHKAVRRAIAHGELVAFQPAHKLLVREQDARSWIESRPVGVTAASPAQNRRRPSRPRGGNVAKLRELERKATGR